MTEPPAPERFALVWSPEARADLRAIDRETALQILHCVDRYLANRTGDVKKLKPPFTGFRLRCGDYRLFFDLKDETTITITAVRNRREGGWPSLCLHQNSWLPHPPRLSEGGRRQRITAADTAHKLSGSPSQPAT